MALNIKGDRDWLKSDCSRASRALSRGGVEFDEAVVQVMDGRFG